MSLIPSPWAILRWPMPLQETCARPSFFLVLARLFSSGPAGIVPWRKGTAHTPNTRSALAVCLPQYHQGEIGEFLTPQGLQVRDHTLRRGADLFQVDSP